jgi:hypothetical protein
MENKDKYVGEIKNGILDGKGILYYENGKKFIGDWKNVRVFSDLLAEM